MTVACCQATGCIIGADNWELALQSQAQLYPSASGQLAATAERPELPSRRAALSKASKKECRHCLQKSNVA